MGAVKCLETGDAPMQPYFANSCMGEHCRVEELHVFPDEHAAILGVVSAKLSNIIQS